MKKLLNKGEELFFMHFMPKRFGMYLSELNKEENKRVRIAVLVATFSLVLFLSIAITLPLQSGVLSKFFLKDRSLAALRDETVCQSVLLPDDLMQKPDAVKTYSLVKQLIPASETFSIELETYANASVEKKRELKEQLKQKAISRKKMLLEVARERPDVAYHALLSQEKRAAAETFSMDCVEKPATVEGVLDILVAENPETDQSVTLYTITTGTNQKLRVHPANPPHSVLLSGQHVRIKGYNVDNEILFDSSSNQTFEVLASPTSLINHVVRPAYAQTAVTLGAQNVAVILANFQDTTTPSLTKDTVYQNLTTIDNFYKENSYGKTYLNYSMDKILGWYQLPINRTCSDPSSVQNAAIQAADPNIDFQTVRRLIIVAPLRQGTSGCVYAGIGTIGMRTITTQDGTVTMSIITADDGYIRADQDALLLAHELGHNFGVGHNAFYKCGDVSIRPYGDPLCTVIGQGDWYGVMGGTMGHMVAVHKEYFAWFVPSNIQTVTKSGTYVLEPIETNTSGLKALKIPRGPNDFLSMEYRQPIGFDKSLYPEAFRGALLRTRISSTYLIDPSPPSIDYKTVALKVNESFTDPDNNATVTVTDQTSSALTVNVTLNGTATPTATPTLVPTATLTPTPTPVTDATKPTITITNPLNGAIVPRRSTVNITAAASDNLGVTKVVFTINGVVKAADTTNPYAYIWNVPSKPNATYTITATAYDAAGNNAGSSITVSSSK